MSMTVFMIDSFIQLSYLCLDMFNGCIATSILTSNRRKRALTANTPAGCTENNSHLFAPESPVRDNENEDQDEPSPIIEEVST